MEKLLKTVSTGVLGLSLVLLPVIVSAQTATLPTSCKGLNITDDLSLGSTGKSVMCLQALLNQGSDTIVATTGPGSAGHETSYFGPLTKKAVMAFQVKNTSTILTPLGLTKGTGIIGPKTRDVLNKMIADQGGNPTPTNPQ